MLPRGQREPTNWVHLYWLSADRKACTHFIGVLVETQEQEVAPVAAPTSLAIGCGQGVGGDGEVSGK